MSLEKVHGTEEASSEWLPSCAGQGQREQPLGLKATTHQGIRLGPGEESLWEGAQKRPGERDDGKGNTLRVDWGRGRGVVLQSQGPLGLSLQDPRLGPCCSMSSHPRRCLLLWDRKPIGYSEVFAVGEPESCRPACCLEVAVLDWNPTLLVFT